MSLSFSLPPPRPRQVSLVPGGVQPFDPGAVPRPRHVRREGGQVRVEPGQGEERPAGVRAQPSPGRPARQIHPRGRAPLPEVQEEPGQAGGVVGFGAGGGAAGDGQQRRRRRRRRRRQRDRRAQQGPHLGGHRLQAGDQ